MFGDVLRMSRAELKSLNEEIKLNRILVTNASSHYRYDALKAKNPVANLEIPNILFLLWAKIRSLQSQLCISVCKHSELVNDSICGGTVNVAAKLEIRLQNETSRVIRTHKNLQREKKTEYESQMTNMLVYSGKICLTTETETKTVVEPGKENTITLHGKLYIAMPIAIPK